MIYQTLQSAVDAAQDMNAEPGYPDARVYHCGPNGDFRARGAYTVIRAYTHPWNGGELVFA